MLRLWLRDAEQAWSCCKPHMKLKSEHERECVCRRREAMKTLFATSLNGTAGDYLDSAKRYDGASIISNDIFD